MMSQQSPWVLWLATVAVVSVIVVLVGVVGAGVGAVVGVGIAVTGKLVGIDVCPRAPILYPANSMRAFDE